MAERVTSVPLQSGLYVLRYVQAPFASAAPHVFVRPSPGSEGVVEIVTPPGAHPGSIPAPGGCLVVRAEGTASLHITIQSGSAGGGTEAELRLESLAGEVRPVDVPRNAAYVPAVPSELPRLEFLGHVSRRGDVWVDGGTWVAGPDSPAPIEGLEMRFAGQMSGVTLEYQVQIGGPGGAWTPWMSGGYAGTRGQARSLVAARLRLVGARASEFQIEAEALFLGASVKRLKGQSVEVLSGSGVDPLVGLKLHIGQAAPAVRAPAPVPAPAPAPQRPSEAQAPNALPPARSGRVRVFRSAGLR